MKNLSHQFLFMFCIAALTANAKENKRVISKKVNSLAQIVGCPNSTAQLDLDINNIRARILNGGDLWWDMISQVNYYEVPIGSNKNSLYCGALWIGGYDGTGALKVAAQTYRQQGANDFWPGPISRDGITDSLSITNARCSQFDRFWSLTKQEVQNFISGGNPTQTIVDYPGNGNVANGELPFLAPFFDANNDGVYDYATGDYPYYNFSPSGINCNNYLLGDKTIWWVFNDIGNIKSETGSDPMGLEIRAQAFAFSSANQNINNTTFYKYQIINRSSDAYTQCRIGQWVDADLGNAADDYVGCDVMRGLGFCYNGDPDDDGAGGYGLYPPAIGTDFLQGPIADAGDGIDNNQNGTTDENGEDCTMSKFVHYYGCNGCISGNPSVTDDYYQYLSGLWLNGQQITYGADGQNISNPSCNYMFPGTTDPAFPGNNWTMSTAGMPPSDMRYLQSVGAFTLNAGEVDFITVATVWARDNVASPFPSVAALQAADDDVQAVFNNCFVNVGLYEPESVLNVTCSPNPFTHKTVISFTNPGNQQISMQVYNLKGKLVREMKPTNQTSFTLERDDLKSGVYLYRLMSDNKSVYSGKIVVL